MKCPFGLGVMDVPQKTGDRPVLVPAIDVDGLKAILDDPTSSVLLIDCRPFLSYNSGHIRTAHNVYYPPILRRRHGLNVPLESILGCGDSRKNLMDGQYHLVVAYDDSTFSEDGLIVDDFETSYSKENASSHNLLLVLHSLIDVLSQRVCATSFRYLNGGFDNFSKICKHLVRSEVISKSAVCAPLLLPNDVSDVSIAGRSNHLHCGPNCNKQSLLRKFCKAEHHVGNSVDTVKCHSSNDRGDPVEIQPWLYLGNAYQASREDSLKRLGIFALLNVAEMTDTDSLLPPVSSDNFCHMNLPIADSAESDISCNFPQAIEFIENVRLSGGKVLVHCLAGISRSPTICIAYLMYCRNLSLDQAHDFVKQRRSLISPNLNFMRQLFEFERLLAPRRQSAVNAERGPCDSSEQSVATMPFSKSVLQLGGLANLPQLASTMTKSSQTDDRKTITVSTTTPIMPSRKRPRPDSLSFSIPCSGKPLKSVPYTPCTKQAIFTFDFPSVTAMTSSPTVSHSPLCSPT